jgi:hypothetical protein
MGWRTGWAQEPSALDFHFIPGLKALAVKLSEVNDVANHSFNRIDPGITRELARVAI